MVINGTVKAGNFVTFFALFNFLPSTVRTLNGYTAPVKKIA